MYIDLSSNQGTIDFKKLGQKKDLDGVILRSTTQNGKLDVRAIEYYNGTLQNLPDIEEISFYKFSYAFDYHNARMECAKTLWALSRNGLHFDYLYLDIEKHGRDYTKEEASAVILGYVDEMSKQDILPKLRLYCNYNYLKNIIDQYWYCIPIWLARYNKTLGDTLGANVVLWQYTSKGQVEGINGNVDLSMGVTI